MQTPVVVDKEEGEKALAEAEAKPSQDNPKSRKIIPYDEKQHGLKGKGRVKGGFKPEKL